MRYLMLVRGDPDETCAPDEGAIVAGVDEMDRPDVERLTTVRRRPGRVLVTDGPFPETKEGIAGWRED